MKTGAASVDGSARTGSVRAHGGRAAPVEYADVAQLAERLLCKQQVVRSKLTVSTNNALVAQRESGRLKSGATMARNHPGAPVVWHVVQRQNARPLSGKMQVRVLPCQPDGGL